MDTTESMLWQAWQCGRFKDFRSFGSVCHACHATRFSWRGNILSRAPRLPPQSCQKIEHVEELSKDKYEVSSLEHCQTLFAVLRQEYERY